MISAKKTPLWIFMLVVFPGFCACLSAQSTLKDAYKNYFLIGASLNRAHIVEEDKLGASLITTQFNTISPENTLKWESVHPQPDRYNFELSDRYVAFGEKYGMAIIGHTLIWHNQTPDWVFKDKKGNLVNRDELLRRLRDHIQTLVGLYKGKIKGWDVVNEALNEDGTLRQSLWLKIIGKDFIDKAFQFAHEADPKAELYYNDYSLEIEPKLKGAIELVKHLRVANIPIRAIGLQCHSNLIFPTISQLDHAISEFAKLGVKVNITELDVNVLPDPDGFAGAEVTVSFATKEKLDPYRAGLPSAVQQNLANRYRDLFRTFLNHRKDIERVTFWNVTDRDSWLNNFPVRGRTNYPLLFDRKGKAKLAFDAVIQTAK